jgi:hypothetical protein
VETGEMVIQNIKNSPQILAFFGKSVGMPWQNRVGLG